MITRTSRAWPVTVFVALALFLVLPTNAAERPEVYRGKHVEVTGMYELLIAETFDGKAPTYRHSLNVDNDFLTLTDFEPPKNLRTGDMLVVSGRRYKHQLEVESLVRLDEDHRTSQTVPSGSRSVAIIYLNFSDKDLELSKIQEVPKAMYSDVYFPVSLDGNPTTPSPANVKASMELSSYNLITLNPDADDDGEIDQYGPYDLSLPSTSCGLEQAWANAGDLNAELEGADMSIYQHRIYIVPHHLCNWNGLGIINCGDNCRAWSRTDWQQTLSHELGHNFGLNHAAYDANGDGNIGTLELTADNGVMMASGNSQLGGHLMHSANRDKLGWFDHVPGALVEVDATDTYSIADLQDTTGDHPQTLRLNLDVASGTRTLYVSYRQGDIDPNTSLVNTFFSPDPLIADSVRVHECFDSACTRTEAKATLREGHLYLDQEPAADAFPLLIEAHVAGEVALVDVYYGDTDNDGVPDYADNCYLIDNSAQVDTDCDGFGNVCDADFNNDGNVNVIDLGIFRSHYFSDNALTDLNSDGVVNSIDLGILNILFFQPPGPAGPYNACGS